MEMHWLIKYLRYHILWTIVGAYCILTVGLYSIFEIDIMIPCLVKKILNVNCPGCGLTRASASLMVLDVKSAYNYNKMVFVVIPASLYFVYRDMVSFKKG